MQEAYRNVRNMQKCQRSVERNDVGRMEKTVVKKSKEKSNRISLLQKMASHSWSYYLCSFLGILLATAALLTAVFCTTGTVYLYEKGLLQMDENAFQEYRKEKGSLYWESLEAELMRDAQLYKIFVEPGSKLMEDKSLNALTEEEAELVSGHILELLLEEKTDQIAAFCDEFHVKYWIVHRYGRPMGGNQGIEDSATAWICRCYIKTGNEWTDYYYVRLWAGEDKAGFLGHISPWTKLARIWLEDRYLYPFLAAAAFVLWLLFLIFTGILAVKKGKLSKTILGYLPAELLLGGYAGLVWFAWHQLMQRLFTVTELVEVEAMHILLLLAVTFVTGMVLFLHLLRSVQQPHWYRQSLLYGVFLGFREIARAWMKLLAELSITWRFFWSYLGICAVEVGIIWIFMEPGSQKYILLGIWVCGKLILIPALMRYGVALVKLKEAAKEFARGNVEYRLESKEMPKALRAFGEDMNAVAGSVQTAVNERMKSEHLKTELITNVSHDIKTPLTSIINFSDLIRNEKTENEKIAEYAEHLHQQSVRLKKLLEDLMEASKVSTGNVEVHLEPCDIKVLLGQCLGEFEPRLQEKGLELVARQGEESLRIMADNRMLWRVFENLMNNICKYAQKDTRVYLNAECVTEEKKEWVQITFKNVSKYALDIPPEELMERFVRGDLSRHTEGSGLGLSIVSSLMELQGGRLSLSTDGDLFKAILLFPKTVL